MLVTQYSYDPGILPGCAKQCILGNVCLAQTCGVDQEKVLRSDLAKKGDVRCLQFCDVQGSSKELMCVACTWRLLAKPTFHLLHVYLLIQ